MDWVTRKRPSPAFVLAAIALFVALGGGAYAVSLGRNVVTARSIVNGAVKTGKIRDGAVTSAKLADGSVNGNKVADRSLTGGNIAPGTITGQNILDGSVGSADLGAGSVLPANVATIPTARVRRTAGQTIPDSSTTAIAFTTETWKTVAGMHSNTVNNSRLTAPIDGVYLITASVLWQGSNVGTRSMFLEVDGTKAVAGQGETPPDSNQFTQSVTTAYDLSAGDFVQVDVNQNRGSNLSIDTVTGNELSPEFSMTWLGPA